jgi:hypothetical protein
MVFFKNRNPPPYQKKRVCKKIFIKNLKKIKDLDEKSA